MLTELANQVLLGTERRAPQRPKVSGPLGELFDLAGSINADHAEEIAVLRTAGAMAVCGAAGFVPPVANQAPLAPCPTEDLRPLTDSALLSALTAILDEGPDPLRHEALQKLAAISACLPPRLLPRALSLGQKDLRLRPVILKVMGKRGAWLAGLSPSWAYAVGAQDVAPDPSLWEHGTLEQRQSFLGKRRAIDSEGARKQLQQGMADFDARERAGLMEAIGIGLTVADEDFLESLLTDRSKEVRQSAAGLLARLPASRYAARMAERVAACLGQERKLFRQVLSIEPPEKFGAGWKEDALEETRAKSETLGDRAWWLYQIARTLPLEWWSTRTGMPASDLIKWAQGGDWSEALLRAWSDALRRKPDAAWAAAFLQHGSLKGITLDHFDLLGCLPAPEREPHWLRLLGSGASGPVRGDLLGRIVQSLQPGEMVSADFAKSILKDIRAELHKDNSKWDYNLRKTLPDFVCLIPAAGLDEAARGWPEARPETDYFNETLARVLAIVELRKTLNRNLQT